MGKKNKWQHQVSVWCSGKAQSFDITYHPRTNPSQPRAAFEVWGKPTAARVRRPASDRHLLRARTELHTCHVLGQVL